MATTQAELIAAADDALLAQLKDAKMAKADCSKEPSARIVHALAYASWVVRQGSPPPAEKEPLYPPDF